MSERTAYENISQNSVFSVYALRDSSRFNSSFSRVNEVMGYNDFYWYIDDTYHSAIQILLSNDGWFSDDFEQDNIGELKFTFTIESHPEFFI